MYFYAADCSLPWALHCILRDWRGVFEEDMAGKASVLDYLHPLTYESLQSKKLPYLNRLLILISQIMASSPQEILVELLLVLI